MHHNDPNTKKKKKKYYEICGSCSDDWCEIKKESQKFGLHFLPRNQPFIMKLMKIVLKKYVISLN